MARQPIVLTSNLIPNLEPNTGALGNINYINPDPVMRDPTVENEDGTFTIPTYERTVIDIPDDFDWSQYGRAGPTLRYFHRVRTGEIEYDPSNDVVDPSTLGDGGGGGSDLPTAAEVIKQELIQFGQSAAAGAGAQIGRAFAKTGEMGSALGAYGDQDFTNYFMAPKDGLTAKIYDSPGTLRANLADRGPQLTEGQRSALNAEKVNLNRVIKAPGTTPQDETYRTAAEDRIKKINEDLVPITGTRGAGYGSGVADRSGFVTDGNKMSAAGRANVFGSLGAGGATVAYNLIAGKNLKDSAKAGAKVAAGSYIGGLLIPGPFGSVIGSVLGGRVICNELHNQGLITKKQLINDYKFTRDYLTPAHVNGYHVWAVWMVKQMRKGKYVNFWKHIVLHRANEISYIYGETEKPDYLGKVYRKIFEPVCWSIGFFCKKTDWTVLYNQKEV